MVSPTASTIDILTLIEKHGTGDYIGEQISQLAHSLQCAHAARHAIDPAVDNETIIAALLHDIGQFLPADQAGRIAGQVVKDMRCGTGDDQTLNNYAGSGGTVGRVGHESIGAAYLKSLNFSDKICAPVGSHVAAKRYLCAKHDWYWQHLSHASKKSLEMQGGVMSAAEVNEWENGAWSEEMCRLRKWEDAAKVVGLEVDPLESYRGMIEEHLKGK